MLEMLLCSEYVVVAYISIQHSLRFLMDACITLL